MSVWGSSRPQRTATNSPTSNLACCCDVSVMVTRHYRFEALSLGILEDLASRRVATRFSRLYNDATKGALYLEEALLPFCGNSRLPQRYATVNASIMACIAPENANQSTGNIVKSKGFFDLAGPGTIWNGNAALYISTWEIMKDKPKSETSPGEEE